MATYYFDPISGSNGNDGLSFANRKQTFTGFTPAAGDECRVIASPTPTAIGDATWTNFSPTVTLAGALTANIDNCDSAWTAATNVTPTTLNTAQNYKEGSAAQRLTMAAAFTTGRIGHKTIASTDFSAYEQVSFWVRANNLNIAANVLQVRLCSDTGGTVAVNTLPINVALPAGSWMTVTLDNAGALGNAIQSVAFYANSDPGALQLDFDNIIACKAAASADSLTLTSLIGTGIAGEPYYMLQSINGTTVILGGGVTLTSGSVNLRGYTGTSQTIASYKRESLFIATNASQTQSSWALLAFSGSAGNPVTISGGWNRTDMSTQTGETWLASRCNSNIGMSMSARSYINISKFGFIQQYMGIYITGASKYINVSDCYALGQFAYGYAADSDSCKITFTNCIGSNNSNYGFNLSQNNTMTDCKADGNVVNGLIFGNGNQNEVYGLRAYNGSNYAIDFYTYSGNYIEDLETSSSGVGSIQTRNGVNYLKNAVIGESVEVVFAVTHGGTQVFSHDHDGTPGNHYVFMDHGYICSETGSDRDDTRSGAIAWEHNVTSANATTTYPLRLGGYRRADGIKMYVTADTEATVSVRVKRSNAGITARMVVPGGQIDGVPADVTATAAGGAGSYETISLNFTPTEAGWVDVFLETFGGTSYQAWFDSPRISQV